MMTSTSTVIPGQESATIPAMIARTPTRIIEVGLELNMGHIPFSGLVLKPSRSPPGCPTSAGNAAIATGYWPVAPGVGFTAHMATLDVEEGEPEAGARRRAPRHERIRADA